MEILLPDPITNRNRQNARLRYLRREAHVLIYHPGFNLHYWRRIIRTPDRVQRLGRRWKWSPEQIDLVTALLISRMACVFVDHMIHRMEQTGVISPTQGYPTQEWETQYRQFLRMFLRLDEIPDRRAIVKTMQRLHYYTLPPASLLSFRQRHWTRIDRCLAKVEPPAKGPLAFVQQHWNPRGRPLRAARRLCFIATLYADIQERLSQQQWMYSYSDCMLRVYDLIRAHPNILAALIQLS